jgi:cyclopropane fatty-acyl-phospholipid synthase-like methyltransferase
MIGCPITLRSTMAAAIPTHRSSSLRRDEDRVVAYYDQTWLDYQILWINRDNLAFHYGYHDHTTSGHGAALLRMNQVLADRAAIRPGERVLDAGCGIGGSSMWLAAHRGAEVVGITLSGRQVTRARRIAQARDMLGQATFEQADYTATPFPDGCFEVVWAIESVCHAADKAAFYREAARLLRPGGRLVVAEFLRTARPLEPTIERMLHEWLDGWAMPDLDTGDEHLRALAAAGFGQARLEDVTTHIRPSSRRLHGMARWSYPGAVALRWLGIRSTVQHGNVIAALRQYQVLERGGWWYGILSATKR